MRNPHNYYNSHIRVANQILPVPASSSINTSDPSYPQPSVLTPKQKSQLPHRGKFKSPNVPTF